MAAELRLGVSFDLVYFRQQLGKLSQIAASEFAGKVKLNIDKRDFQRQMAGLTKELRININDSQIVGARTNLGKLNQSIATLRRAVAAPIEIKVKYTEQGRPPAGFGGTAARAVSGRLAGAQAVQGMSRGQLQAVYGLFREANLAVGQLSKGLAKSTSDEIRDALVPAFSDSGEEAVNGLANGLKGGSGKVSKAAAKLGEDTLRSIKDVLGIASPSREFKKIGEDSGEGFEQGLKSGLGEATRMGIQEMRSLFRALQGEAQSGAARLQATMLAAMAGIVQLPGGRQQRGRLMQTGAGINAAMAGPALGNVQARRAATRGAAASAPTFAAALPLMFGMHPRELTARLQGLYGQQYRAPAMGGRQAPRPGRIASLIAALASSGGGFGAGTGVNQRGFAGGAINPGLLSSGYIGRSAISPGFLNYPPGMPPAYGTGFIGAPGATYGMMPGRMQGPALPVRGVFSTASGSLGQFPTAGMMGPSSPLGSMGRFPLDNTLAVGGASAVAQKRAGSTPWLNTLRGARGGYVPSISSSLRFPMSGMMGPSSPLGVINAQSSMFGGGGPGGGGGGGRGGFGGFPPINFGGNLPNLPGQGLVREMGSEFGFAAKQVLLFGAAYKGLALLTGLPGQVTEAVSALQNFRNTLTAITPSSEEFRDSNQLILDLVEKYNVPLQSARDGFTKLYASMQPAGFSGDEIRTLFTGISKAAATFGMSADKVDRVNYAFAQMASKGQVMSEELKGQLGDVLPGAMAIFTEAAGFKGPNAISEFSKALEDGAYKGEAMKVLLTNVGTIMNKEFGPGAEGAARTFQGAMNRMQNSMKLLYETFEPVAVGFLNAVVVPFSNGIKTLTDGLNAFFTGAAAKTAGGFGIAQELEKLRPAFEGLSQNVGALAKQFLQMAGVGLEVAKVLLQIAGNPFVGYIARVYAVIVPLNLAFSVFRGLLASTALQFVIFNARLLTGTSTLTAFRGMMAATGQTAAATAATIRGAFATTGIGLVLVGLGLLIERFSTLSQRMQDVKAKALGAAQAINAMSSTEARREQQVADADVKILEKLLARPNKGQGAVSISQREKDALERAGVRTGRMVIPGQLAKPGTAPELLGYGQQAVDVTQVRSALLQRQAIAAAASRRIKDINFQEAEAQKPATLAPIPPGGGDGKGKRERQLRDFESEAIEKLRVSQRIAQARLDQQRQLEIIDDTEYEIASAANKRKFELSIIDEALAEKKAKIGDYEVGVRQKQLAVFEQLAENERTLVKEEEAIAVKGAKLKLSRPFKDALRDENVELEKQRLLIGNLQAGFSELTPEQQASLIIEEKTKDLRAKQQELIKSEINNLKEVTSERIRGAQALARETELLNLRNQAAQLRAPLGQERLVELMQTPGYTPEQAKQQFDLEEQNKRLQVMRQGASDLAGTINSSIGDALTNIVTDFQNLQQHGMTFLQTLANGFKQLANTIIQEMTRAMISKAVSQLFSFIMPNLGATGGFSKTGYYSPTTGLGTAGPNFGLANGGIINGHFMPVTPFATGGMVTGPTLGLVGEGRFNEAVVPLPNGKSIPVDLGQGAGNNISTNIVVNMNNGQSNSQVSGRGGQALGREIEGAVRNVILKETRPGGLIYGAR